MRVTLEKLPGVESVTISLNEGVASIRLKPDNTVALREIRRGVERNGFTPREAHVTARAEVLLDGRRLRLRISGSGDVYDVSGSGATEAALRKREGSAVRVQGLVPLPKDSKGAPGMQVKHVEPVAER